MGIFTEPVVWWQLIIALAGWDIITSIIRSFQR